MTAAEIRALEEQISLLIEPKPSDDESEWKSEHGAWCRSYTGIDKQTAWFPLQWARVESSNAMLLEMMAKENSYVWIEWDINEWCVSLLAKTTEDQDPPMEYSHKDRKLAVCLALKAWKEAK